MSNLSFPLLGRACVLLAMSVAGATGVPLAAAADGDAPAPVVKLQKPPVIDGDAADWAPLQASQSIPGKDGEAASVKLGYDTENFYALLQIKDDSPLKNSATVLQELLKGGDAVGFCFGPATNKGANQRILIAQIAGRPLVLAMRPEWHDKSKPYTYRTSAAGEVKMDYVALLPGAQAALKPVDGGYVAEVKIPWTALGYAPADGLNFPFDVQVIFSDSAGSTNVETAWWHSTGTGPTATMDIAIEARLYPQAWGKARLYAKDPGPQKTQRTLDEDAQVFYGPGAPISFELPRVTRVSLIVTNEAGWVVRELLRTRKLGKGQHTVYWDGRDRTHQLMPPGEYRYRIGYFDGIKATFYGSVGNSGRPVYRTPDGMGSIGGTHGGPSAVAADAGGVYLLHSVEEGQKCLRKIDPATGKALWFASTGVFGTGYAVAADDRYAYMIFGPEEGARLQRFDAQTGQPAKIGAANDPIKLGKITVQGLAIVGDKAYYSEKEKNRLGVVDLKTGQPVNDIAVQAPSGLCKLNESSLLVCSGTQVLKLDTTSGQATPVIRDLVDARAVAVDRQGAIYVSDLGSSQQIKKYAPDGTLQASFGKAGGRALTVLTYDPLEFLALSGLAVGPDDNLWMVEHAASPRRHAKLTRDGKWLEDFYGPVGYVTVAVDLDDFSSLYYQSTQSGPEYIKAKLDYAAYAKSPGSPLGTWKVEALYNMTQNGANRDAKPDLFVDTMTAAYGKGLIFTATNGKRYFWKAGTYSCLYHWQDGRWRAAAAVNNGKADGVSYWADANGDGLVQDAESSKEPVPTSGWTWIDRDLTLHGQDGSLAPARIDEQGVPHYAGGKFIPVLKAGQRPLDFYFDLVNYYVFNAPPASDGSRYYVANIGPDQGRGFWDRAAETRLMKVKNGKPQWIIGHHDGAMRRDGDNQMLMNMTGEQDGVIIASEVSSNFTAYTSDGLTLGWVSTDEKGRMAEDGPNAWYVENVQPGLFLKDPKTGKHLLFGATTEDVRVVEITGVFGDDITRLNGKVTLPSPQPRSNVVPGQYTIPYSTWILHDVRFLGVSAYDWRWAKDIPALALAIADGKSIAAEVRLRRDAGMLCVFADVLDATPLPQVDAKTPADLFSKADGIELLLGPVLPDARTAPVAGDTRIFLSATRNKDGSLTGTAMALRPASPPLPASPTMRALNEEGAYDGITPTGPIDFSKLLLPIPGSVVVVRERLDALGYRLEAEIPLALLPELTTISPVNFKRNKNINTTEPRPDLTGALRFNAALWLGNASQTPAKRLAWVNDAQSPAATMNPSAWGMANAQVYVQWPSITGAVSYSLYRATSPDPARAVLVKKDIPDTRFVDLPGLGEFYYWLAAADDKGEGQWCGPMQAREGAANFVSFTNRPAAPLSAIPAQYVFPGTATVISVAVATEQLVAEAPAALSVKTVKRSASLWTVVVTAAQPLPEGKPLSVRLVATAADKSAIAGRFTVIASPVPLNGYSAVADIMTGSTIGTLAIDPSQPADGAAGKSAVTLGASGRGLISQMAVGKHGFALFRWKGQPGSTRQIHSPFVDTLENDGFDPTPLNHTSLKATVGADAGDIACARAPHNGQSSLTIKATDAGVHLLTLISGTRTGDAPPTRYSVTDPRTKATWILADIPATKGATVIQLYFSSELTLTLQQTEPGKDQYDCANIGALFFD